MPEQKGEYPYPANKLIPQHAFVPMPWDPDHVLMSQDVNTYIIDPAMAIRDVSCIICGKPVMGDRVSLHVAIFPQQCDLGTPHLLSLAVLQHADCPRYDNEHLYALMEARLAGCLL